LEATIEVVAEPGVSNISLRLAGSPLAFFSHAGNMSASVVVVLDPATLNAVIAATNGSLPRPPWVDLDILVSAVGPGSLTLSAPRIELRLTNPVLISFDPVPGSTIEVTEGGSIRINWTEVVQVGDVAASGDWYIDNIWVLEHPLNNLTLGLDETPSGNHTLAVVLRRDGERFDATWSVVVSEPNLPPDAYLPHNWEKRTVSYTGAISITGTLRDDDLDPLNWTWMLDGGLVVENTSSLVRDDYWDGVHVRRVEVTVVLDNLSLGEHRLILRVTDGKDIDSDGLTIVSQDHWPYFYEVKPFEAEIVIQAGEGLAFDAPVFDLDGDPIARQWYLDNAFFEDSQQAFLEPGRLPAGVHHVRVVATSTNHSIPRNWAIQVVAPPPPLDPLQEALGPMAWWIPVVALSAVVGAAAAVLAMRRT
jgi:hypothetical protein